MSGHAFAIVGAWCLAHLRSRSAALSAAEWRCRPPTGVLPWHPRRVAIRPELARLGPADVMRDLSRCVHRRLMSCTDPARPRRINACHTGDGMHMIRPGARLIGAVAGGLAIVALLATAAGVTAGPGALQVPPAVVVGTPTPPGSSPFGGAAPASSPSVFPTRDGPPLAGQPALGSTGTSRDAAGATPQTSPLHLSLPVPFEAPARPNETMSPGPTQSPSPEPSAAESPPPATSRPPSTAAPAGTPEPTAGPSETPDPSTGTSTDGGTSTTAAPTDTPSTGD